MKLYAMALMARKTIDVGLQLEARSGSVIAINKEEAIGKAMGSAKREFPVEDHWHSHSAIVSEVPQWQLDELS